MAVQAVARGLMRGLDRAGWRCLTEVPLPSGHRADVMGLDAAGRILIAEIKSSRADFRADHKWQAYLAYCDMFAFAVGPDFPVDILPPETGVFVCDDRDAHPLRAAAPAPPALPPARRRQTLIRFARLGADRWRRTAIDPDDGLDGAR